MTLTTVGYGDLSAHSPATKLFVCTYILFGVAMVGALLAGIVEIVLNRQARRTDGYDTQPDLPLYEYRYSSFNILFCSIYAAEQFGWVVFVFIVRWDQRTTSR